MKNPFEYSNYVTGKAFCNRTEEKARLLEYIEASQNVLLYSHRRIGKSSLIKKVFQEIQSNKKLNIGTMYIDLYGTVSEKDFISRCFKGLSQIESNLNRLITTASNAMKTLRLNVGMDINTGTPTITPTFGTEGQEAYLEELMRLLEKYSGKRKLVVAFDEFQDVCSYAEDNFEKRLRTFIQGHSNICYIFSGSQQHLLTEMFSSKKRAFFKLADSFPIGKIDTKHYIPWIQQLFKTNNITIEASIAKTIVHKYDNHPMHIQNFLFHLWNALNGEKPTEELITAIENKLVQHKNREYENLWDNLTLNQKKTLILIVRNKGKNLFGAEALQKVDLKTASLVTRTLKALIARDVITKNGHYQVQDIVFEKWLIQKTDLY